MQSWGRQVGQGAREAAQLAAFDEALARAPDDPRALCGKAGLLEALGLTPTARDLYRRAAEVAPPPWELGFALARLAVEAGDWADAELWATRLAAQAPGAPQLRWLAARIALGRDDATAAQTALEDLLADPRLGGEPRAESLLMLAEALRRLGRPAEAFAAARDGKAILRRLYAPRAAGREDVTARFERLQAGFAAMGAGLWRPGEDTEADPDAPRVHVFLTGFPRSGTTLLEQALAGHPEVVALEEAPTLAEAHAEFLGPGADLGRLARISDPERREWRTRYWASVRVRGVEPEGRVFVDKAPAGVDDLPLIASLFPQARVLFAVRDPRDVVLSCFSNAFQMNALTYAFTDLTETARAYAAAMALGQAYGDVLPLAWREVRHEAVVDDFEGELRAICGFLDLAWEPAMLDVAATAHRRAVRTPSAPQVRGGLTRGGLGRWRDHAEALSPVIPLLKPWISRWGYARD